MPSMNISMTPELIQLVQAKVDSGQYNNASEVMRDALRRMDKDADLINELKLSNLRNILALSHQQFQNGDYTEVSLQDLADIYNSES